jgi:hypothetical protein
VQDELAMLAQPVHFQFQVGHVGQQQLAAGCAGSRSIREVSH